MTQPTLISDSKAFAKLLELIGGIRFAMLTTCDSLGHLRSRPMRTQQPKFDGALWFFADDQSPKSAEINSNHQVNISYADPDHHRYVSVSGMAQIEHDRAKMREFWDESYAEWFPKGFEDPNLCLIRVKVEKAEYWDFASEAGHQKIDLAS